MSQFIGIYENAFSKEYCERTMRYFDNMKKQGFSENRQERNESPKTEKDDTAFFGHSEEFINMNSMGEMYTEFNNTFWNIFHKKY